MLYISDDSGNSDVHKINILIAEQFLEKQDVFRISKEQLDKESRLYHKIKSNFYIPGHYMEKSYSNLTRVNVFTKKLYSEKRICSLWKG